jgi:O-antigen/teichoic acid export membrane protein
MSTLKRALIVTSAQRYLVVVITFGVFAAVARLLTPSEIGVAAVGVSTVGVCQVLRDFGIIPYLVQLPAVSRETMRTSFTLSMMLALALSALLIAAGPLMASFYGELDLKQFMYISAAQLIVGTFYGPIAADLQREMAFGKLSIVEVVVASVGAVATIAFALLGFGALSIAWSALLQSIVASAMPLYFKRSFWAFRPCLKGWRTILSFGTYTSAGWALVRAYELFTNSVCGRVLSFDALGHFNRASMICDLPLKGVLSAIFPVALPALAAAHRDGYCLKKAFLDAVGLVTAVLWPALAVIAIFSQPIVDIVLGSQWTGVQSLVPIIAMATLFSFPSFLTYPMLVLAGNVRQTTTVSLITLPVCALIVASVAPMGLQAIVWSLLITIPLQNIVSLIFIRRCVHFEWDELIGTLRTSALITLLASVPLLAVVMLNGFDQHLGLVETATGLLGAGLAWLYALAKTQHPLWFHVEDAIASISRGLAKRYARTAGQPQRVSERLGS